MQILQIFACHGHGICEKRKASKRSTETKDSSTQQQLTRSTSVYGLLRIFMRLRDKNATAGLTIAKHSMHSRCDSNNQAALDLMLHERSTSDAALLTVAQSAIR